MQADTPIHSPKSERTSQGLAWKAISFCLWASPLMIMALVSGCSESGPELALVQGEVFMDDKPAAGAIVSLHPGVGTQSTKGFPFGVVAEDGFVTIETPPHGVGAPVGNYVVTVMWPVPVPGSDPDDAEPETTDRLEGKYSNPKKSEIKIDVAMPETKLPRIDLE